jgi:hypothetical protein
MKRLFMSAALVTSLGLAAVAPAVADPREEVSMTETGFGEVDPCTGATHDVTFDVTFLVHEHDGRVVARGVRTLSTTLGYRGRGTSSFVSNGRVEMFRFGDMLTDDSGNRIRANGVLVVDLTNDTVRVDRFTLTCVGG